MDLDGGVTVGVAVAPSDTALEGPDGELTVDGEIGDQLGWLRTMRGLSQDALAERAGLSVDVIRRLEQGVRGTARLGTLSSLAEALGAQVSVLLVPRTPESGQSATEHLEAVRRVLTTPDALVGFAEFCDDDAGEPNIAALEASAETMWSLCQEGEYVAVSALLPDLITDARHAARELVGDEQVAACAVLATASPARSCPVGAVRKYRENFGALPSPASS